jgi:hypothetical protein
MPRWADKRSATWRQFLVAAVCAPLLVTAPAHAGSLSARDLKIIAKALGFLDPPAPAGVVAVVYDAGNAASKSDATDIAAAFGDGLASKSGSVTAKAVDLAGLGDGSGYVAVIVADGGPVGGAMSAAKAHKIPCITGSMALVQSGQCIMAVQSEPKVDITVNHAAAAAAGIAFGSAFQMLIHEI